MWQLLRQVALAVLQPSLERFAFFSPGRERARGESPEASIPLAAFWPIPARVASRRKQGRVLDVKELTTSTIGRHATRVRLVANRPNWSLRELPAQSRSWLDKRRQCECARSSRGHLVPQKLDAAVLCPRFESQTLQVRIPWV
jgi:hypothetical protein